jgi:hypothetical protein
LLIAVGSVLRIREAFLHNPLSNIFSDPERHWNHARATLDPPPWAIVDPPVFQMWLSLVQKWSLGIPVLVAGYAGFLSTVTPWLWYRFLRASLRSRMLALTGWALLAWLPSWIAIFSYFMTETLFLPLLGASLWQTVRARRTRTLPSFCGMVTLWVLTGMTRGIAVPIAGLAGLWAWLYQPKKVAAATASIVIALLATVPFSLRNYRYLHLWSPLGTGWPGDIYTESGTTDIRLDLVLGDGSTANYGFMSPSLCVKPLEPLSQWESKRSGLLSVVIDTRKGAKDWRAAYKRNAVHGLERLKLRWENLVLVMLGPSWPDNNPDYRVARVELAMRWIWLPLFLLVSIAAILRWRTTLRRPLVPMTIAVWFFFQAVSLLIINEGRYRKPLEGLLIVELLLLVDSERFARYLV